MRKAGREAAGLPLPLWRRRKADATRYQLGRNRFMSGLEGTLCAQIVYHKGDLSLLYMNPNLSSLYEVGVYLHIILICEGCNKHPLTKELVLSV